MSTPTYKDIKASLKILDENFPELFLGSYNATFFLEINIEYEKHFWRRKKMSKITFDKKYG